MTLAVDATHGPPILLVPASCTMPVWERSLAAMGNKSVFVPSTTPLLDSNNMSQIHVTHMTLRLCLNCGHGRGHGLTHHPFYALAINGSFLFLLCLSSMSMSSCLLDRVGVHWYRDRALLLCDSARGPAACLRPGFQNCL